MKDKYTQAVEYLERFPEAIGKAWMSPHNYQAGCLFRFVGQGCITMVKSGRKEAYTPEFTELIRSMKLPTCVEEVDVKFLKKFARIQRKGDKIRKEHCLMSDASMPRSN